LPVPVTAETSQTVEFAALLDKPKINRSFNGLGDFSSVPSIFVLGFAHDQKAPEAAPPISPRRPVLLFA
jgi:hypothetical protein